MNVPRLSFVTMLALVACSSSDMSTEPIPDTVTVAGPGRSLNAIGDTITLTATVKDGNGQVLQVAPLWTSLTPGVATVSNGLVTARKNGSAQIEASYGTGSGQAMVTVQQVPTALVKLSGDSQTAAIGQELAQPLEAILRDRLAHPVAGVSVAFAAITGGGLPTATGTATDSTGIVQVGWTLGDTVERQYFLISVAAPVLADTFLAHAGDGLDSLPRSTATAEAVVNDLFAAATYAVQPDCAGALPIDCPGGTAAAPVPITVTEDSLGVVAAAGDQFNVTMFVAIKTDTVPVTFSGSTCGVVLNTAADTVTVSIAIPVQIDSLVQGDPPDRASVSTVSLSGITSQDYAVLGPVVCSGISGGFLTTVLDVVESAIVNSFGGTYCGAPGPTLLGPCPPVGAAGPAPRRVSRVRLKVSGGA